MHKEGQFKCLEQVTPIWRSALGFCPVSLLWQNWASTVLFRDSKKIESLHDNYTTKYKLIARDRGAGRREESNKRNSEEPEFKLKHYFIRRIEGV